MVTSSARRRDGCSSLKQAEAVEIPEESSGDDPCKTPLAHAVMPPTLDHGEPTSRDLLLDDRVERLLKENLALMQEREQLREIADLRAIRTNEMLNEIRHAKKLCREWVAACVAYDAEPTIAKAVLADAACDAMKQWAAKTI